MDMLQQTGSMWLCCSGGNDGGLYIVLKSLVVDGRHIAVTNAYHIYMYLLSCI